MINIYLAEKKEGEAPPAVEKKQMIEYFGRVQKLYTGNWLVRLACWFGFGPIQ